jgi:hypothetical protein
MSDSIYIQTAKQVMRQGGFKARPTHNGYEIRDEYEGRHLHTVRCRHEAQREVERLNAQGPRLVWENIDHRGPA